MIFRIFALFVFISFLAPSLNAQYKLENFTDMNQVNALSDEGDYIWVCTSGGVFKRRKSDGIIVSVFNTTNSGISRNRTEAMYIDFYGNYWFGSFYGGISKFDGKTWTNYDNIEGSPVRNCMAISEDINGNIWFGAQGKVVKYDGTNWEVFSFDAKFWVTSIISDDNGEVWIGLRSDDNKGMIKRIQTNGTVESISDPWNKITSSNILDLAKDQNGNIWIGVQNGGAMKIDPSTNQWNDFSAELLNYSIYSIAIDGDGNVWFGHDFGVTRYNGSLFTTYKSGEADDYNRADWVRDMVCDANGKVWLGSYYGIARVDQNAVSPITDGWTERIIMKAISTNAVEDIAFLSDGSARMYGQFNYGIKYDAANFSDFTANGGCNYSWIRDIALDQSDNTWMAYLEYNDRFLKVIKTDPGQNATCFLISDFISYEPFYLYVNDISYDRNNNFLWIATNGGLYYLNTISGAFGHLSAENSSLPDNNVTGVSSMDGSRAWFSTQNGGIGYVDNSFNFTLFTQNDGIPYNSCLDITVDNNGLVWFLSNNFLVKYNGTTFSTFQLSGYFSKLVPDNKGNIWMGGSAGAKFNGDSIRMFTLDDGLNMNSVQNISFDNDGNTWLTSGYFGITKLSLQYPVADFIQNYTCLPEKAFIQNTSSNVDGLSRYEWDINNDGTVDYTTKDLVHQFESQGQYVVKLTVYNDNLKSDVVKTIKIIDSPVITTNPQGEEDICAGNNIIITASVSNFNPLLDYTFEWNTNATSKAIRTDTSGTYFLSVSNGFCTTESAIVKINSVKPYNDARICMVTVDSTTNKNLIVWERTENSGIESYNIYKLYGNNYVPIGNVPYSDKYSQFTDFQSNPDALAARYAITVLDTCGNESDFSPYHQTIHLGASAGAAPNTYVLDWTPYIDESGVYEPEFYYCWAGPKPDKLEMIYYISSSFTAWNDNAPGDRVYYKIESRKTDACFVTLPGSKKASSGPYVHSLSNLEDNRLQATGIEGINALDVNIYPNPMQNWSKVSLPETAGFPAMLRIYNLSGRLVKTAEIYQRDYVLERENLESGFYYIKIDSEANAFSGKLIVR